MLKHHDLTAIYTGSKKVTRYKVFPRYLHSQQLWDKLASLFMKVSKCQTPVSSRQSRSWLRAVMSYDKRHNRTDLEHEVHFLRKALSNQRHYIDSVHETTIGLISNDKVEDLLERILSKAGRLAGTPDTFLYLYDSDSDELFIKLGQGIYTDLLGTRIKTNQGLAGEVYNTGKAILIDDYATWSRRIQHPIYDTLHSAIGIPLKSKTSIVGVIGLGSFDSQKPFSRSDRENMHRFAELASIALENARINTELKNELKVRKNVEKALRKLNMELEKRVAERTMRLEKAFSEIKTLKGILPICSHCKKIRNDEGYWTQIESYIKEHSEAQLSHGICLDCAKKYYPDINIYEE